MKPNPWGPTMGLGRTALLAVYILIAVLLVATSCFGQSSDEEIAKAIVAVELAKLSIKDTPVPAPKPPGTVSGEKPEYFGRMGWMQKGSDGVYRPVSAPAAPGVAAPSTFQSGIPYNSSHNCPNCGRSQYVISGWNRDGTHWHECSVDHTRWFH